MEYYGYYAGSTTAPMPNIYKRQKQHRRGRHNSTSDTSGVEAGGTQEDNSNKNNNATSNIANIDSNTASPSEKDGRKPGPRSRQQHQQHARTSFSSEFSSSQGGRSSLNLDRPQTSSHTRSRPPTTHSNTPAPRKIKRKSFSAAFQRSQIPLLSLSSSAASLSKSNVPPASDTAPPPPVPLTKPPAPPPPQALDQDQDQDQDQDTDYQRQHPLALFSTSHFKKNKNLTIASSPSSSTSTALIPIPLSAATPTANTFFDVEQYHPASPASPTFPSSYLSHLKLAFPLLASSSSPPSAAVVAATATTSPPRRATDSKKDTTTTTTSGTRTRETRATTGPPPPPPPPPHSPPQPRSGHPVVPPKPTPGKLTKPDPRMLANTSKHPPVNNQKQLPALPPTSETDSSDTSSSSPPTPTPKAPNYAAPPPPTPNPLNTPAYGPRSSSITTPTAQHQQFILDERVAHPHHAHGHANTQQHAAMAPEPGTPHPLTTSSTTATVSSSSSSQAPNALSSRFSVPFVRTESVISSTSAATTLSSRTMQSSDPPSASVEDVSSRPFVVKHGRTHLNDPTLPYPLPVDLPELHRQSLRTLLLFQLFGGPVCSPAFQSKPPGKVLEVGCGSGFWSMMCHRYFARHGHSNISFTGIDIAPLSSSSSTDTTATTPTSSTPTTSGATKGASSATVKPKASSSDMRPDKDMKWRFLQHDLRRTPWPFQDSEFDLIMIKDMSLTTSTADQQAQMDESLRVLKPGGTLEIWESDHTIRLLRPHVPSPSSVPGGHVDGGSEEEDMDNAATLGAYVMTANTPLSAPLNNYLVEYNAWVSKAFDARSISTVPCTTMGPLLLQESEVLVDIRSRRLAVPLSEMRWEREGVGGVVTKDGKTYIETKGKATARLDVERKAPLSSGQVALRRTALLTVVNMVTSLEPVLREVSGKSQDEWDGWVGKMMGDLMEGGAAWGECLEVGAWWARKKGK